MEIEGQVKAGLWAIGTQATYSYSPASVRKDYKPEGCSRLLLAPELSGHLGLLMLVQKSPQDMEKSQG